MFDYKGTVVAITGCTSGVGKELAYAFAELGANVCLLARRLVMIEDIAKDISKKYKVKTLPISCDVMSEESIKNAVEKIKDKFGHVEVLVNNAGGERGTGTPNNEYKLDDWNYTLSIGLTSKFMVSKEFVNFMEDAINNSKQQYGRIINIGSVYGLLGNNQLPSIAYNTACGAIINYTRSLASELATKNITVNCVCTSFVYTDLVKETLNSPYFQDLAKRTIPMQRFANVDEIKAPVVFFASKDASYVTGQIISVDGGYTII